MKLTTRQWNLYKYVKFLSLTNCTTDKEDIVANVDGYVADITENKNFKLVNCSAIYYDIKAINDSPEIEKIIVVDKNVIRLGNEEECIAYAEKLKEKAMKLLSRYGVIMGKVKKDGQGKLVSNQDKIIDENSKARAFVETYL